MPFLSREKLYHLARQILAAIAELHSLNIAHRDIKIENIILTPDGGVRLIDYGLSCAMGLNKNAIGCINPGVGTQGYQDIKVIPGDLESMKSADLWAFGQILVILFLNRYWGTYHPIYQVYMTIPPRALSELPAKLQLLIKNLTDKNIAQKDRLTLKEIALHLKVRH
jgi:serine/threonine protein kinase